MRGKAKKAQLSKTQLKQVTLRGKVEKYVRLFKESEKNGELTSHTALCVAAGFKSSRTLDHSKRTQIWKAPSSRRTATARTKLPWRAWAQHSLPATASRT